jgi:hypothetical protein
MAYKSALITWFMHFKALFFAVLLDVCLHCLFSVPSGVGCGQLLMYRYFRNSILIDLLPELFPPGFRERERTQA